MNSIPVTPPALGVSSSLTNRRWLLAHRRGPHRGPRCSRNDSTCPRWSAACWPPAASTSTTAGDFLAPTLRALLPDPSVFIDMDVAADRLAHAVPHRGDGWPCSAITTWTAHAPPPSLAHVAPHPRLHRPHPRPGPYQLEGYGPNALRIAGHWSNSGVKLSSSASIAAPRPPTALASRGTAGRTSWCWTITSRRGARRRRSTPPSTRTGWTDTSRLRVRYVPPPSPSSPTVATVRTLRRTGWFATRPEPDLHGNARHGRPGHRVRRHAAHRPQSCPCRPGPEASWPAASRPGIAALLEIAAAKSPPRPAAMTLGFALGPRINAAGRIDDAGLGLRLLLTDDPVEARALATRLDAVNRDRQELEAAVLDAAHAHAHAQADAGRPVLLVHGAGWHPGVVGIIAGRIKQRQNRPALAGALADGVVRGSGRSVAGIDLGAAVLEARREGLLTTGGGHAMAAGFSLHAADLDSFHAFLEDRLAHAAALPRTPDLDIEATVSVAAATVALAGQIAQLAPFGAGNEEPTIALPRARIVRSDWIGRDGATLRLFIEGEGGEGRVKAMLFRAAGTELGEALSLPGTPLHLAGQIRAEEWNGTTTASFIVTDAAVVP